MPDPRVAFGPFVLDPAAGTLLRDGAPVLLGHRAILLLAALVDQPGAIVGKAALMDAAWPDMAVEEGNLTVQIAQLRKALGKAPDGGEWIATIPRVGYRFAATVTATGENRPPPKQPEKPSIAVLPFDAIGGEADDSAFADGLTADLITDLSRNAGLFVIARNSAFAWRGKAADAREIAEKLGVRYLLEGSARRAGDRVRINAQLVDAVSGDFLWADRFDRDLADVFAVQDEVTARIVEALLGKLGPPPRARPKNLEAWELVSRSRRLMDDTPQDTREAELMLTRAIALEPDYAEAHRWLAMNRWMGLLHAGGPSEADRTAALELARKAVTLDENSAGARWVLGYLLTFERRFDEADSEFLRAQELDPNEADIFAALSDLSVLAGRVDEGLAQIGKALRLNPFPPGWYFGMLGQAHYAAKNYEAAVSTLRRDETYATSSRRFLAAALARLGRLDEARAEAELFLVSNPGFSVRHWAETEPFRDAAMKAHFVEGFLLAGLPG